MVRCPACYEFAKDELSKGGDVPIPQLTAPGVCPKCGPLRLFEVTQPMVQKVLYKREVWAPDAQTAEKIVEHCPTEWPSSYDTTVLHSFDGPYKASEIVEGTDDGDWRLNSHRRDVGFDQMSEEEMNEFLQRVSEDD